MHNISKLILKAIPVWASCLVLLAATQSQATIIIRDTFTEPNGTSLFAPHTTDIGGLTWAGTSGGGNLYITNGAYENALTRADRAVLPFVTTPYTVDSIFTLSARLDLDDVNSGGYSFLGFKTNGTSAFQNAGQGILWVRLNGLAATYELFKNGSTSPFSTGPVSGGLSTGFNDVSLAYVGFSTNVTLTINGTQQYSGSQLVNLSSITHVGMVANGISQFAHVDDFTLDVVLVAPEPASLLLLGLGGLIWRVRRR